jgi:hypothetical protein
VIGEMNARAVVLALASVAFGLVGCFNKYQPHILAPCVSGDQAGDSLTVRLGATYDATSNYVFEDGALGPRASDLVRSCAGQDGLASDSVVTFALTAPADATGTERCSPWMADFQPEGVTHPELARDYVVSYTQGVTIADASVYGPFNNAPTFAARALYTPSGDPHGALVTAQLPPLVFARGLSIGNLGQCFDIWLATWETAR